MLPDRVSKPGSLTYESGALPMRHHVTNEDVRRKIQTAILEQDHVTNEDVRRKIQAAILELDPTPPHLKVA